MRPFKDVDLQQLLEDEGENLGNLSQHLALLGIRWYAEMYEDPGENDPSDRVLRVVAQYRGNFVTYEGSARLYFDGSGDWTFEELILSELELALRMLWRDPGAYTEDGTYFEGTEAAR